MALPTQQFNPYSNSYGNTNFLGGFGSPAVMPQQGGGMLTPYSGGRQFMQSGRNATPAGLDDTMTPDIMAANAATQQRNAASRANSAANPASISELSKRLGLMGGFAVSPQQGQMQPQGMRQIPQEMIDANARASALTALEAPTNYSAEYMRNMMKSPQGGGGYGAINPNSVRDGDVMPTGFDTNGPDVNSPYFAGFSAPMPSGYNTGAPVNFNSMVDSFGQPYVGRGNLGNDMREAGPMGGDMSVGATTFSGMGGNAYQDMPQQKMPDYIAMGMGPVTQTQEMRNMALQLGGPSEMPQQQMTSNVANTMSNVNSAPTSNPAPPPMAQSAIPTSSNIDPAIQPYLGYGLSEAQRLYQAGGPQYYGGPTFVSPSTATQTGLQALEARASLGNPLLQSAQNQLQGTVSGDYLSGNPFFQGAFQPAARAAETQFKTTLGDIASKSSLAGRYGSGAMGSLQDRATGAFSQSLANTAGQLAYQNYADERQRQQAATMAAPAMTSADYQDIQNLLNAGQVREGYTGQQLQSDMARFNFLQNQPQVNLQTYLSSVYGNPTARMQQQPDTSPSNFQNLLGLAAVGGGLYKNLGQPDLSYINPFSSSFLGGGFGNANANAVLNPYFTAG
jgi:hypothetical protein